MNEPKVINFGCRLNAYESEVIQRIACEFGMNGYVIINTCAVTSEAERQVKQYVRKVHRENPDAGIILTGCAATYAPDVYIKMDGVVAIIDNNSKLLRHAYKPYAAQINTASTCATKAAKNVRHFIQIQNGCDNFCTYCIVRKTRGPSVSLEKEQILDDVQHALDSCDQNSVCEIVLTGVNISSYNKDGMPLADLVVYILEHVKNLERLRLSSLDPADIDEHFIDIFAHHKQIMPHLHLSVQSGDNMILARMRRRHKREDIIRITSDILKIRPDTIFGSDFITGFPTETEAMFENTCRLIEDAHISLAHVFPYSERSGTPASLMPQLPKFVRKDRARHLIDISQSALNNKLQSLLNTHVTVLAETEYTGKTDSFLSIQTCSKMERGHVYNMRVVSVNNGILETVVE